MIDDHDSIDSNEILSTQNTRSSNVKVYEHVLPRIDAEKYQADIPPMLEKRPVKEGILFCVVYCILNFKS